MKLFITTKGVERMSDEYMPSDMQYKDNLRKQRDNWAYVIKHLENSPSLENDDDIKNAYERAKQEYDRIIESLQD